MYDHNNIFAQILRGEIPCHKIYESDYSLAFYDINPQAKVHALVICKGAYCSFADFAQQATTDEIAGYCRDIGHVARLLGVEESGYRLLSNHGADSQQEVAHLHVHLCGGAPLGRLVAHD